MVCIPPGKHAPDEVKILPLDLSSGEDSLRIAVEKAESFFPDSGVDYMIHNAAFERPVSDILLYPMVYLVLQYACKLKEEIEVTFIL